MNKFICIGIFFAISSLCIGCKDQDSKKTVSYQEKNAAAFSEKLQLDSLKLIKLLPETKKVTDDWAAYATARNEIRKFPDFSLQEVVNNSNNLLQAVTELQKTMPDTLMTIPAQSRVNVLYTKANVLHQVAQSQQPKAKTIKNLAAELYKAFSNFEIQLNEVFLKSIEDVEKEFDKALQNDDSLEKPEKIKKLTRKIN